MVAIDSVRGVGRYAAEAPGRHSELLPDQGSIRGPDLAARYIEARLAAHAANSTINKEIGLLKRSLNLARLARKICVVPMLPSKLVEDNVRKGFFERADFVGHRAALPEAARPVTTFAFWTGCRKGEILTLIWPQVDLLENVVRLKKTKNGEPGLFLLLASASDVLRMQKQMSDERWPACPWVFSRRGQRIRDIRVVWDKAWTATGLVDEHGDPTKLFHDLRRTGVRNLMAWNQSMHRCCRSSNSGWPLRRKRSPRIPESNQTAQFLAELRREAGQLLAETMTEMLGRNIGVSDDR